MIFLKRGTYAQNAVRKSAYKERKGGGFEGNFYWITRCLSCVDINQEKDNIENKVEGCLTNFIIIVLIISFILQGL
jgi:spore maturation protein SpmB